MPRSKKAGDSSPNLLLPERKRKLKLYMLNAILEVPHDFLYVVAHNAPEAKEALEAHVLKEIKKHLRSQVEDLTVIYPELLARKPLKVFSDTK